MSNSEIQENQQLNNNNDNDSISTVSTRSTITVRNTSEILKKLMDKIDSLEKKIENNNINNNQQFYPGSGVNYLYGINSNHPPYLSWSYISDLFWNTDKLDSSKRNENGDFIISAFDFKELIFSICYIVFITTCFLLVIFRKNKLNTLYNSPIDYIGMV